MPLYIGDYDRDTGWLTRDQHGCYFLLLKAYWANGGPLPADPIILAGCVKATGEEWAALEPIMLRFFRRRGEVWSHKRVDLELARATAKSGAAKAAGRAGGLARAKRPLSVRLASARPSIEEREIGLNPNSVVDDREITSLSQTDASSRLADAKLLEPQREESKRESKIPLPSGSGVSYVNGQIQIPIPHEFLSIKTVVFREGLKWVAAQAGRPEMALRSWLGKVVNQHGELKVLDAIRRAQAQSAIEPVAFIEGCLRQRSGTMGAGVPMPAGMKAGGGA